MNEDGVMYKLEGSPIKDENELEEFYRRVLIFWGSENIPTGFYSLSDIEGTYVFITSHTCGRQLEFSSAYKGLKVPELANLFYTIVSSDTGAFNIA